MSRTVRRFAIGRRVSYRVVGWGALALAVGPAHMPAWAAAGDQTAARNLIIGVVIGIACVIGIALYHFSQRSGKSQYQAAQPVDAAEAAAPAAVEDAHPVLPAILNELSRLPGPAHRRQQVARQVVDLVDQSVQQRLAAAKHEFTQRYQQLTQEHRRLEAALERKFQQTLTEKKQTAAVLESIAEGLVVVNATGDVVMMNPAAEKLLGMRQQEQIGKPLTRDMKDEQLISMVRSSERGEREIVLAAKQDSTKRVLRSSNAVISDESGNAVGMVAVLSDVTKQRELDELKSEFLSKVSHELRTPLVAMRHGLSILIDQVAGPVSEEQQKFLDIVQRNLDRLSHLINDLLDLSKLEAKKMELHLDQVALAPLIEGVSTSLQAWAGAKRVSLSTTVAADLPEVLADDQRIIQVVTNLMGNALKFTPEGGQVTVAARRSADGRTVEVSVSDTGVGIAAQDIPKLFNKFQQVGERSAADITGTGLGLAISKEIIELHQGRIWAESKRDGGATFFFTLDVAPDPAAGSPA